MSEVAQFKIHHIQYLNELGVLTQNLPSYLDDESMVIRLYKNMVLVRQFDKKAIALQRTGKMGTYAPITGQEAISTAIGDALKPEDVFVPYYRDYGAQIQRGVKMSEIFAYWGGDERGSDFECQSQDLPICVPIASQCLHAAGVAFAFKYRNEKRVALVCIGEGGTSEGDFYEALNIAGTWNLPVVFVINNNQWAISVPTDKQTHCETFAQKGIAAGLNVIQIDGNDIFACRDIIGEAIESARSGNGPTLIEAITYRLSDHTTADDATRYQPKQDVETAHAKEPLIRTRKYIESKFNWSQKDEDDLLVSTQNTVNEAQEIYLSKNPQPISSMFDFHYESLPTDLISQRESALEEQNND